MYYSGEVSSSKYKPCHFFFTSNRYPDVVVGAYDTNKALVLRSRPVVNIETIMQNYPEKINPSETVCAQDGRKQICFNLRVCFRFSAMPLDR